MESAMRLARLKNALKLSPQTVGRLDSDGAGHGFPGVGRVDHPLTLSSSQSPPEADIEKVPQLAAEVDRLKGQWTTQQIAQLESNYAKANELIFKTEDELDAWRLQIREQAGLSGLKVKDSLSAGRLLPQPDLALSNLVALCELEPAGPEQPSATPLTTVCPVRPQSRPTRPNAPTWSNWPPRAQGLGVTRAKVNLQLWLWHTNVSTNLTSTNLVSPNRP